MDLLSQRLPDPVDSSAPEDFTSQMEQMSLDPSMEPLDDDLITPLFQDSQAIPSVDLIKNLVDSESDFNYFKNTLMNNWAGPEHWKFKPTKNQALKNTTNEDNPEDAPAKK